MTTHTRQTWAGCRVGRCWEVVALRSGAFILRLLQLFVIPFTTFNRQRNSEEQELGTDGHSQKTHMKTARQTVHVVRRREWGSLTFLLTRFFCCSSSFSSDFPPFLFFLLFFFFFLIVFPPNRKLQTSTTTAACWVAVTAAVWQNGTAQLSSEREARIRVPRTDAKTGGRDHHCMCVHKPTCQEQLSVCSSCST